MKVGDLVKYKEDCDATGWIGLVTDVFGKRAWVAWINADKPLEHRVAVEVLEVIG